MLSTISLSTKINSIWNSVTSLFEKRNQNLEDFIKNGANWNSEGLISNPDLVRFCIENGANWEYDNEFLVISFGIDGETTEFSTKHIPESKSKIYN